jgi:hydrogenase maturation factor HypE
MDVKSIMTDEMRIFLRENIRGVLAELILELETPSEVKQFAENIIDAWTETQKELKTKFKTKKSKK